VIVGDAGWRLESRLEAGSATNGGSRVKWDASRLPCVAAASSSAISSVLSAPKYSSPSSKGLKVSPKNGGLENVANGDTGCDWRMGSTTGSGRLTVKKRTNEVTSGLASFLNVRMSDMSAGG